MIFMLAGSSLDVMIANPMEKTISTDCLNTFAERLLPLKNVFAAVIQNPIAEDITICQRTASEIHWQHVMILCCAYRWFLSMLMNIPPGKRNGGLCPLVNSNQRYIPDISRLHCVFRIYRR